MNKIYKKAITEATEAVRDMEDLDLKKSAFEILLRDLLQGMSEQKPTEKKGVTFPVGITSTTKDGYKNNTVLTQEEIDSLFEVKKENLLLKIKPTGKSDTEKQQKLAHAILVGYKAIFGKDSVPVSVILTAARDWNLSVLHFGKNIQLAGYVQGKGVKKGAIYSLKPGAVEKLKESIQKMARGE